MHPRRSRPIYRGPTPVSPRMVPPPMEAYVPSPQVFQPRLPPYGPAGPRSRLPTPREKIDLSAHYYGFNAPPGAHYRSPPRFHQRPREREISPDLFDFATPYHPKPKPQPQPSFDPDPYNFNEPHRRLDEPPERSGYDSNPHPSRVRYGGDGDDYNESYKPYSHKKGILRGQGRGLLPLPDSKPRERERKEPENMDYHSELAREKALRQLEKQVLGHDEEDEDSRLNKYGQMGNRSRLNTELYEGHEEPFDEPQCQYARPKGTEQYDEFGYDRSQHGDVNYLYPANQENTTRYNEHGYSGYEGNHNEYDSSRRRSRYDENYDREHEQGDERSKGRYRSKSRSRSRNRDRYRSRNRDIHRSRERDSSASSIGDRCRSPNADRYKSPNADRSGSSGEDYYGQSYNERSNAKQSSAKKPNLYVDFGESESEQLLTSYQPREINQNTLRAQEIGITTTQIEVMYAQDEEQDYEEEDEEVNDRRASAQSIAELTHMFPGMTFTFIRQGSVHKPIFLCQCTIKDESYFGYGGTKKEAKQVCSQNALDVMEGDETIWQSAQAAAKPEAPHVAAYNLNKRSVRNPLEVAERNNGGGDGPFSVSEARLLSFIGKHPVPILLELCGIGYESHKYTWRQDLTGNTPVFTCTVTMDGNTSFEGSAGAKKEAKRNAAKEAVIHYFGFDPTADPATQESQIQNLYEKLNTQHNRSVETAAPGKNEKKGVTNDSDGDNEKGVTNDDDDDGKKGDENE